VPRRAGFFICPAAFEQARRVRPNKKTRQLYAGGFLLVVQANQISNQELEELKKLAIIKRQIDQKLKMC
jgi:hypothetical protein